MLLTAHHVCHLLLSNRIYLTTAWISAKDGILALHFTDHYLRLFKVLFKTQEGNFHFLYIIHTCCLICVSGSLLSASVQTWHVACKLYKSLWRDWIWRQSKWHFFTKYCTQTDLFSCLTQMSIHVSAKSPWIMVLSLVHLMGFLVAPCLTSLLSPVPTVSVIRTNLELYHVQLLSLSCNEVVKEVESPPALLP